MECRHAGATFVALLAISIGGCEDRLRVPPSRARSSGNPGADCRADETRSCACLGSVEGVQRCASNGTWANTCECPTAPGDAAVGDGAAPPDAVGVDVQIADAGQATEDAGVLVPDAGHQDAAVPDFGPPVYPDATPVDVGFPDAGFPDTGVHPDAAAPDADPVDVGPPDSGLHPDTGPVDAGTRACTSDSQCPSRRCHPLFGQCIPAGRKLACEICTAHSECGMPGDECMGITAGGRLLEQVCGQACRADADCIRGYTCQFGGQCYPKPGSVRTHTCASLRDMLGMEVCDALAGDTCGVTNFDDGTCFPLINMCVVGCDTGDDCPPGSNCIGYSIASYCVGI